MYRLARSAGWGLAMASLALLVGASAAWIGCGISGPHIAKDYEDCAEEARANVVSSAEYSKLITPCGERFAGRRKAGGGYTPISISCRIEVSTSQDLTRLKTSASK
jgi:hypothetical protein